MNLKKIGFILLFLLTLMMTPFGQSSAQDPEVLTLALYPNVPDIERFKSVIREEWAQRHPEIRLEFSDWDCYSGTLPENVDVFAYDAIYLREYQEKGLLLPLSENEINAIDDFYPFAIDACTTDGVIHAVPEFLCSEFLYTRKDDTDLGDVENIRKLYDVLGTFDTKAGLLPLDEGLLVNIPDKMSASFWLVQAIVDAEQTEYDITFPITSDETPPEAANSLHMVRRMAGFEDMTLKPENNNAYIYGEWFADGVGRAFIGFSEAMSVMGDMADEMDFRLYSMTEEKNIPLFYADLASVNAKISEGKRGLAVELLNLITSTDVLVRAISPAKSGQRYQYLLSARESFYDVIGQNDMIYTELETFVSDPDNRIFMYRKEELNSLYDTSIINALLQAD